MTKEKLISAVKNSKTAVEAAKLLGISRAGLFSYLKKRGLRYNEIARGNGNSGGGDGNPNVSPVGQDLFHAPDLCKELLGFLYSLNPYKMQSDAYEGYQVKSHNQTITFYVRRNRANERQAKTFHD